MTTYTADQVRAWTADNYAELVGQVIDITVAGMGPERGRVAAAGTNGQTATVELAGDGPWTWGPEVTDVEITVLG